MWATVKATLTTTTPTKPFRGRSIGRKGWTSRLSTSPPTAVSRRECANGWIIGTRGAKSCNETPTTRVDRRKRQGGTNVSGRSGRVLAEPADVLGPEGPDCPSDHYRHVDRRTRGQMDVAARNRSHSGVEKAHDRRPGGNRRAPVGNDRQADHLAGRNHGRTAVPRHRSDPRAHQYADPRDIRLPTPPACRRRHLLRRAGGCAHRPPSR